MTVVFPRLGHVGRLGNQLFQLASTIGLANTHMQHACLPDDWIYREWFSIPAELFGRCGGTDAEKLATHLDPRCAVYLQDYNLFARVMPQIHRYLQPSGRAQEILEAQDGFWKLEQPVLSVHVRRGDNVFDAGVRDKHRYFPVPPLAYYDRAVYLLRGRAASVAVFSDDPEWCEANLGHFGDYFHHGVTRPKEHEPGFTDLEHFPALDWVDLQLMARCTAGHVLSNSTFGIWGAILAQDNDAIYPWPWYGPALRYINTELQFPPGWHKLDYRRL